MLRSRQCGVIIHRLLQFTQPAQAAAGAEAAGFFGKHVPYMVAGAAVARLTYGLGQPGWNPAVLGLRPITTSQQQQQQSSGQQPAKQQQTPEFDSLELTQEKINAVTDKIPQKPVGVVEGTSYTLIILAAFGVLGFFVYNFVVNFIFESVHMTCFNTTLERLKLDPRITVRLGKDITGYGQEAASRVARQQIPHQMYKDNTGQEHVRLQFHMRGSGGVAVVNADMYKDNEGRWEYSYLIVDVRSGSSPPQRLNIIAPK